MSVVGSGRMRSAMSASSTGSRVSGRVSVVDRAMSRPTTSLTSLAEKQSSQSRQSGFRSGNRMLFTDLLCDSSRVTSSFAPAPKSKPMDPVGSRMLFTGPDETERHRINVGDKGKYVGSCPMSREISSDSQYLYRPCRGNEPAMRMRHERVGEIGWNVPKLWRLNKLGK